MKYYEHTLPSGIKVEAIDLIEHLGLDFNAGNVVKYIARAGQKTEDSLVDINKAYYYARRMVGRIGARPNRECTKWRTLDIVSTFINNDDEHVYAARYVLFDILTASVDADTLNELRAHVRNIYSDAIVIYKSEHVRYWVKGIMSDDACRLVDICDGELNETVAFIHELSSPVTYRKSLGTEDCCEAFYYAYCSDNN